MPRRRAMRLTAGSPPKLVLLQHWTDPLLHWVGTLEGLPFGTAENDMNKDRACMSLEGRPTSSSASDRRIRWETTGKTSSVSF